MEATAQSKGIGFDVSYLKTLFGILKCIALVTDIVIVVLAAVASRNYYFSETRYMAFVGGFSFVYTVTSLIIVLLNVPATYFPTKWSFIELIACGFIVLFYIIGSVLMATIGYIRGLFVAVAFFGFTAFVVYLADIVLRLIILFKDMKKPMAAPAPPVQLAPTSMYLSPNL